MDEFELQVADPELMRSMSSSGEYLQSKQITEQNSNREQEALSEKEKEDATNLTSVMAGPYAAGTCRSTSSAREYLQSKQIAERNSSNREQEALSEKEKEDATNLTSVMVGPYAAGTHSQSDPAADKDGPKSAIMHNSPKTVWYVDCGVTHHATGNQSLLLDSAPVRDGNGEDIFLGRANGEMWQVRGRGSVRTDSVALDDVWYVPGLDSNRVSTGQLTRQGCDITLGPDGCRITRGDALVGSARFTDSYQFELDFLKVASSM